MKKILFLIFVGLLGLLAYQEHAHKAQIAQIRAEAIQQASDDLLQACENKIDEILGQF